MTGLKELEDEITAMVEVIIADKPSLFLISVKIKGNQGNQRLIVLIDGDDGITIDQCSEISRSLAEMMEERELIKEKYYLEVSSAGLDHPLQSLRQYKKNIGRDLKVALNDGTLIQGKLKLVGDGLIILEESSKKDLNQHHLKFEDINKSIVLVSFK